LPRKWAVEHGIKKGDELDILESGNKIIISTEKGLESRKITLDISAFSDILVKWLLYSIHKSGYDEVELNYKKPNILPVIQKTIKDGLMGFEIIEQSENKCVIKNISENLETEFSPILRRVFLINISMAKNSLEAIKKGNPDDLKNVIILEDTNNKLTNFCERILNQKGYKDSRKTNFIYIITWQLESIADDYKALCRFLSNSKKINLTKDTLSIYEEVNDLVIALNDVFYKFENEKLVDIKTKEDQISDKIFALFKKAPHEENIILTYLLSVARRITDLTASIMAINFH